MVRVEIIHMDMDLKCVLTQQICMAEKQKPSSDSTVLNFNLSGHLLSIIFFSEAIPSSHLCICLSPGSHLCGNLKEKVKLNI